MDVKKYLNGIMNVICKSWCFEVNDIFYCILLQRIYDDMNECCLNTIGCNLTEQELFTSKPKLRTLMKFKDNIYTNKYIKYCYFKKRRSVLVQF